MLKLLNVSDEKPRILDASNGNDEPAMYDYSSASISSSSMSVTAMGELGYGDTVKAKGSSEGFCYVVDVSACTKDFTVAEGADKKSLILTKSGIGFRLAIVAWGMKAEATANLGMIAASVETNAGHSQIYAECYAKDVSKLGMIADITKFSGRKFDAAAIQELAEFVSRFVDLIASEGATIEPTPSHAIVLHPHRYQPQHVVASNNFAIVSLDNARPRSYLNDWLRVSEHDSWQQGVLSPVVVKAAYEAFSTPGYNQTPSAADTKLAHTLRQLGS